MIYIEEAEQNSICEYKATKTLVRNVMIFVGCLLKATWNVKQDAHSSGHLGT